MSFLHPTIKCITPFSRVMMLLSLLTPVALARDRHIRFERYANEDGLSQTSVLSIVQDAMGFMWFGTQDGLNRFDGYNFKIFRNDPDDPTSISDNFIQTLFVDKRGNLWIGTQQGGLNLFEPRQNIFTRFVHDPNNPNSIGHDTVYDILEDKAGMLWIATESGLSRYNPETNRFTTYRHDPQAPNSLCHNSVATLCEARDGVLWIGTQNGISKLNLNRDGQEFADGPTGLSNNAIHTIFQDTMGAMWIGTQNGLNVQLRPNGPLQHFFHNPDDPNSLGNNNIHIITQDRRGNLWLGGASGGLQLFDSKTSDFQRFEDDIADPHAISHPVIQSIYEDRTGILWVGTLAGGVNKFDTAGDNFELYSHHPLKTNSLSDNVVISLESDQHGYLWLGTPRKGLNRFNPTTGRFKIYPPDPNGLKNLPIRPLHAGRNNRLWVGTPNGLSLLDTRVDQFQHFSLSEGDDNGLKGHNIGALYEDQNEVLWIGTRDNGLHRYEINSGIFTHFPARPGEPNALQHHDIRVLYEDDDGRLWVGSFGGGFAELDRTTGKFSTYAHNPNDSNSLSHDRVLCLLKDHQGYLWIGTMGGGLNRFDLERNVFKRYNTSDGMPNDVVYGILEDSLGFLWLSTNKGLVRMAPDAEIFRTYTAKDGLQGNEFNQTAYAQGRDGQMFFAGMGGFNAFFPERVRDNPYQAPPVITDFRLFNESVALTRNNPESPLKQTIPYIQSLILPYRYYLFSFEFAGLHFANPGANRYAYKLDGIDREWNYTEADKRYVPYTRLDPGSYRFRVKAANQDGLWSEREAAIEITILPPPWKTGWAYALYIFTIGAIIVTYLNAQKRKLDNERAVVQRLRQIDNLKDEFLANTSHELRTPLNGIIGIAESLADGVTGKLTKETVDNLKLIIFSGKRLANLVNDILDFSKLKNQSLELNKKPVDLRGMTEVVIALTNPLIGSKPVVIINNIPLDTPLVWADENRLQQILYNLLGNAVKFTEQGQVIVDAAKKGDRLLIKVSDTGIGIPKDKISRIFKSFEQGDSSIERVYGGTGLGLAITKRLVERHGGSIKVKSTPNLGTVFSFTLSLYDPKRSFQKETPAQEKDPTMETPGPAIRMETEPEANETPTAHGNFRILIVDDEPINRQVFANQLSLPGYQLTTAADGSEALELDREQGPFDLVLLDIMMPRLSGYEVCRKLRERYSLHELPIIFLTAKDQITGLSQGFSAGANDYLIKPVEKIELLARVKTHLDLLSFNRVLESKVNERTRELTKKNNELLSKFQELETLERIVKTVNNEVAFKRVIDTLLEQGLKLFPEADHTAFLEYVEEDQHYRLLAASGFDPNVLNHLSFTSAELYPSRKGRRRKLKDGLYIALDFHKTRQASGLKGIVKPKALIGMSIDLKDGPAGFFMLASTTDPYAFRKSHMTKLKRFREHVVSAVAKAKIMHDLASTQKELLEAAHLAGMAEIATNVLHNVGNTLNSVKTSAFLIQEWAHDERALQLLKKLLAMLQENKQNLAEYLTMDRKGKQLPEALKRIITKMNARARELRDESNQLTEQIQSVTEVLLDQHKHTHFKRNLNEEADLNQLIHNALQMETHLFNNQDIEVIEDYHFIPHILVDKNKVIRVILYLLRNAWEAIGEADHGQKGRILIRTQLHEDHVGVSISDNGAGIAVKDHSQLFIQGYTTKKGKAGFGLHYCANAMREMSGTIHVTENRDKVGVTITLDFPLSPTGESGDSLYDTGPINLESTDY